MSESGDAARRIHAEALDLQRRLTPTSHRAGGAARSHPLLHAGTLVLVVAFAAVLLVLLLANPAVAVSGG